MKNLRMSKISTKNILKKIFKSKSTEKVKKKVSKVKKTLKSKNLKVKKIVSQKFFLEKMGIIERAKILERKMTLKQRRYMALTLFRLLKKDLMGEKFKVMFAFRSKKDNFLGFK